MLFNSLSFIFVFMPLALIGFHVTARTNNRLAGVWLVLASLAFYAYWKFSFLPVLLASIGFNFTISRLLGVTERRPVLQSAILAAGIAVDILALVYYKYLCSLLGILQSLNLTDLSIGEIILPLGISFFTFTQIGYLVDVKQGISKPRDLATYSLFVSFFPHLIAGPILHNREMMPQFLDPKTYRFS
jgi:alginate O-acetyltransferase complex protein AlgI